WPPASETNAMRNASGDHVGWFSLAGPEVTRVSVGVLSKMTFGPVEATTKRSSLPKRFDENAKRRESGDHAGSLPPLIVMGPKPPPIEAEKSACQDQENGCVMRLPAKSDRLLIEMVTMSPSLMRGLGLSAESAIVMLPEATSYDTPPEAKLYAEPFTVK